MKFYEEKFFNKRNWILEHASRLNLTPQETLLVLYIDYNNEFNTTISMELLSSQLNLPQNEVDAVIASLVSKGLIKITSKNMKVIFNLGPLFEAKENSIVNDDIFELFESELGKVLSQKELVTISEWLRIYDRKQIINGLREALIAKKKSLAYIEKVIVNGSNQED